MTFLWPSCGRFCECLWHVQRSVLGAVWIKKSGLWILRGCLNCLKTVYGLFVANFVSWFVIVCGMSKKLLLGAVWMKRKIRTVKGLLGQFYGQLKGGPVFPVFMPG